MRKLVRGILFVKKCAKIKFFEKQQISVLKKVDKIFDGIFKYLEEKSFLCF